MDRHTDRWESSRRKATNTDFARSDHHLATCKEMALFKARWDRKGCLANVYFRRTVFIRAGGDKGRTGKTRRRLKKTALNVKEERL